MNLEDLRRQINTKPDPWTKDRTKVWYICDTQRKLLNELINELKAWREGTNENEL